MAADFSGIFDTLKPVLASHARRMAVSVDKPGEYTLVTKAPSPFPQHKGHPMFFASVKLSKAYVSFHLMPLYMNPGLTKQMSPELKKRMQGKSCFNFKTDPEPEAIAELKQLTEAGYEQWSERKWV